MKYSINSVQVRTNIHVKNLIIIRLKSLLMPSLLINCNEKEFTSVGEGE